MSEQVGCPPGEHFNEDWDADDTGCLDAGAQCCYACGPGTFQPANSRVPQVGTRCWPSWFSPD